MALIATNTQKAEVHALGTAMNATVNFSGALMEMLATVYAYILMSAIREAVQNACDASKRAGLSFSEGVLVQLPTPSNPMITVIDKGSGMTKAFMEDPEGGYLSYGTSTKAGDNGAAGGLGIGRWAAYGYIRECYITTCHASDMVQRTYFQFQGENSTPKVQPAAEVPGTVVGTKVAFPIKDTDLDEALRAVAWLKEVMQLTMGDSFSVDNPAALPSLLPAFSGTVLDLGTEDSGLKGVLVYPMHGNTLKYGRQGLQSGSLVVLTNKEAGVGGLPFHVQSPGTAESVFQDGMVVEIPMSFSVPFMPSREEIKYTDEVNALLKRIDAAAAKAVVTKAKELYDAPDLTAKATLSNLLGNTENWHWFARNTRAEGSLHAPLKEATGGTPWRGSLRIPFISEMLALTLTVKSTSVRDSVLREAFSDGGHIAVSAGKAGHVSVTFHPNTPFAIAVNDVKTGGTARFRKWLNSLTENRQFVFMSSEVPGEAQKAADALNAVYGGALEVYPTSKMPEVARVVVGSTVIATRSRSGSLTYYSRAQSKQETATMSFATYDSREPVRLWLGKDGGRLDGFKESTLLAALTDRWGSGSLVSVLAAMKVDRLYLLAPKQVADLSKAQAAVKADGLWDLADDDFADDEDGREALRAVKALKSWKTFEEALEELVARKDIQDTLSGKKVRSVKECWEFNQFCEALAKRPRMELTGTSFDKAMAPHIDLLTGDLRIHRTATLSNEFQQLCTGLALLGSNLEVNPDDSDDRKELIGTLARMNDVGHIDYPVVFNNLRDKYPLLHSLGKLHTSSEESIDHLCRAIAAIYR
ncbi:hypothetical protein WJ96_07490 [Burkholderia ubonensis]|uniref:ATP-binding protein n=1 Tax=Burkholderia ubonensis TaxID=101571 RepID=A0AAW3MX10_9BURK|nr:ATP-binding protein [Burkholderia ubonensis]KVP75540.1 hypothetical protein WJ93_09280 [Burkholderia ubonensis]KVP98354.1 hypothetical protein WJ96_07490 [Burkholderia ubonensis]KVZ93052.1 hypothetical protein WL25_19150 [Burkholderia ubonensis]